ncbi:hypothetical protein [Dendrosporobacter sp. 1207_IL3150]|uniref:hypothetical protein n=1 Tax=Dendrosporobacter sp. 1207_IL3150 TaxID=3084054 RepID=UPI002FD9514A
MKNPRFLKVFTPVTVMCLFFLLAIIPAGLLLPPEWGRENGPIENAQVLIIILTCIAAVTASRCDVGSTATKQLMGYSVPILIIIALRELSWGRVFYPNGTDGFLPLKALWYGKYVYPIIGITLLFILAIMVFKRLYKEIVHWAKNGRFPIVEVVILVVSLIAADFAEHRSHSILGNRQTLFEELFELTMYFSLLSLYVNLGFNKVFQPNHRDNVPNGEQASNIRLL